jgi:hypothetical protein
MACTWLAASAGFVARVQVHSPRSTAIRGRPIACEPVRAEDPASVVGAQLRALQSGEAASLRACHAFMSPAYHERADALERFTEWFESPVYESLYRCSSWVILVNPAPGPSPSLNPQPLSLALTLSPTLTRCSSWKIRGAVTTREAMQETLLPDGRSFLGSAPVEQVLRVEVVPGVSKWASARVTGAKIGRALPPMTYEWTLGLQPDGSWAVDRIVPEAPVRVPLSIAAPLDGSGELAGRQAEKRPSAEAADKPIREEDEGSGRPAAVLALVAAALLLTVGRWLGNQTGVFGASLDPSYWDEVPAKVTLGNLLD